MILDPSSPLIIVEVEIEHHAARRVVAMALDTGSTYSIIPFVLAQELGGHLYGSEQQITLASITGTEKTALIRVDAVRALGVEARNVEMLCHNLPSATPVRPSRPIVP